MYHRFEVKELNYGIFGGLDDILDINNDDDVDLLLRITAVFEFNLDRPEERIESGRYWFTQKGYHKFRKALRLICDEIEKRGYHVIHMTSDLKNAEILYADKYQVVAEVHD